MQKSYLVLIVVFVVVILGGVYLMASPKLSPELSPDGLLAESRPINMQCSGTPSCSSSSCKFKLQREANDGWRDAPGGVTFEGKRYEQGITLSCEEKSEGCSCGEPPKPFSANGKNYRYFR